MDVFQGATIQAGAVIAGAAHVMTYSGIAALSAVRRQRLTEAMQRFGGELPEAEQVIVIGDEIPPIFWHDATPGIEIVGIVLCSNASFTPPQNCPTIIDVDRKILESAQEGDLVIVDGDRGRVYVNPDAMTVARYQAPKQHAKRYFLEGVHLPARTASTNRVISVLALIPTRSEVSIAIEQGADGIFIPELNDFLGDFVLSAQDQITILSDIATEIGGLPLFLQLPPEQLALTALLRAAAQTPLHYVMNTLLPIQDFLNEVEMLSSILEDQDTAFGQISLEALISTTDDATIPDSMEPYAGAVIAEHFDDVGMEQLIVCGAQAFHAHKPLTVRLSGEGWQDCLPDALAIGSTRLIVSPEYIPHIKDAIRES